VSISGYNKAYSIISELGSRALGNARFAIPSEFALVRGFGAFLIMGGRWLAVFLVLDKETLGYEDMLTPSNLMRMSPGTDSTGEATAPIAANRTMAAAVICMFEEILKVMLQRQVVYGRMD